QEVILASGGIQILLRTMEAHAGLMSVQIIACGLLRDLVTRSAEHQETAVCRGGAQLALQAMRAFPQSADVQRAAGGALFRMCEDNEEMQAEVFAYGAVRV
ncbi:unnamed protein product, partial [Prorocentrum cordatum]